MLHRECKKICNGCYLIIACSEIKLYLIMRHYGVVSSHKETCGKFYDVNIYIEYTFLETK